MAKTLIPEDFEPTPQTIKSLIAWGKKPQRIKLFNKWFEAQHWIIGDRRIDEDYITDEYNLTKFVCFWSDPSQSGVYDRKKSNWQAAYQNDIKKSWAKEVLEYESTDRHVRPDSGTGGFVATNEAYGKLISDKPVEKPVKRRWKVPTAEESRERFKQLEEKMKC